MVAAVGIVAVALVPMALAGSADDPEIEDGCESAGGPAGEIDTTDIRDVWFEIDPRGEDMAPRIENVVVAFCNDPDSQEFRRAALAGWNGWRVAWTDEEGTQWEVRAWIEHANNMPTHRSLEAPYFQQICRKPPGQSWSSAGSQTAEYQTSETNPGPEIRADEDALALGLQGGAGGPQEMTEIHALGGMFEVTTNLVRNCSTGWADTADRAPDDGFADPIVLVESTVDRGQELLMRVAEPDSSALLGGEANWTIEVASGIDDPRTVTLAARSSGPVDLTIDDPEIELAGRSNATRNLTATVAADAPVDAVVPIEVEGRIGHQGEHLETTRVHLNLTTVGFVPQLRAGETIATAAPGNGTTFDLELLNDGNRAGNYTLSVAGEAAAWASLDPNVTAEVGGAAEVPVTVSVPDDARPGAYDVTIRAEALLTGETDRIEVRTSVHEFVSAPAGATMASVPGAGPAAVALALLGAALLVGRRR